MQNTKKTKLDYTVEALKYDNDGSVASATLAYAMTANAMPATQEKAPYLLRPVMGPSMGIDEFAAEMLKEAGQGTLTEAKYYANVIDEVLEKLLADGKTSVDTGWFSAAPAISGSVPFCNSQLTEENEISIALLPCLDTRKLVAMMETASSPTDRPFDIREVFDVETNKSGIVAGKAFYVFGQLFSDDMTATLIDAAGGEHPCTTPVRDRIPTRLAFTAPAQIAAGKYTLSLPSARRIGDRIFGEGTPESDQLTVVWGTGPQGTDGISASAFEGCGFNMDVQAFEHTREEVERLANFPWGIADKGADKPAKVFTADPPEGGDYWVVERESETGKWRLVAP